MEQPEERLRKLQTLSCFRAPPSKEVAPFSDAAMVVFGCWAQMTRINACVADFQLAPGSKVFFSGDRFEAEFFKKANPAIFEASETPGDIMWVIDDKAKNTDQNAIAATKFLHTAGVTGAIILVTFPTLAEGSLRALLHHAQLSSERVFPAFQASAEIAGDAGVADGWIDAKLKAAEAGDWAGKFNFSPAWEDGRPQGPSVFGIGAPGAAQVKLGVRSITSATIKAWADFVKAKGISHVLCLLNDTELTCYEQVKSYKAALRGHGFTVTLVEMNEDKKAADDINKAVVNALVMREKIVFHCDDGADRTPVALGTALVCLGEVVGAGTTWDDTLAPPSKWEYLPQEYQFIQPADAMACIGEAASKAKAWRGRHEPNATGIRIMLDEGHAPDGW